MMAKYPISIQDMLHDGKMSSAFLNLLYLHVPSGSKILDPTAGDRLLWKAYQRSNITPLIFNDLPIYDITFSDIQEKPDTEQQNLARARIDKEEWFDKFDCVVYDPPYFICQNESGDPRQKQYGDYAHSPAELEGYMELTHTVIPSFLKPKGKLIVKCSDQYVVSERKFYPHHFDWMKHIYYQFEIVDLMIYRYHRMSPTAFQVKDRSCSVIMHSYFIVGEKCD